jgi:cobalt-zinc-cadmium efflux system protein
VTTRRTGQRRRLVLALLLVGSFFAVEVVTALATGSLALLSDAGHMLTDTLGLAMALAAMTAVSRVGTGPTRTFGVYRLEILAALANAVLLVGIGTYAVVEGFSRIGEPPEIDTTPMLIVAIVGLGVNVIAWWLIHGGRSGSLNMEAAATEVLADIVGSVGAIAAALLIRFADWNAADPVVGVAIGLFIIPRALRLVWRSGRILMQAAPVEMDVSLMRERLGGLDGVVNVHDIHVWTLTSGIHVASAHVLVADETDLHEALDAATALLKGEFGLDHATLQVETAW